MAASRLRREAPSEPISALPRHLRAEAARAAAAAAALTWAEAEASVTWRDALQGVGEAGMVDPIGAGVVVPAWEPASADPATVQGLLPGAIEAEDDDVAGKGGLEAGAASAASRPSPAACR